MPQAAIRQGGGGVVSGQGTGLTGTGLTGTGLTGTGLTGHGAAERPLRNRRVEVESGDQPLAGKLGYRLEYRIVREQGITWEVHLSDQPLGEGRPEDREVDVRGAPALW